VLDSPSVADECWLAPREASPLWSEPRSVACVSFSCSMGRDIHSTLCLFLFYLQILFRGLLQGVSGIVLESSDQRTRGFVV
jgi:hypothetical protein